MYFPTRLREPHEASVSTASLIRVLKLASSDRILRPLWPKHFPAPLFHMFNKLCSSLKRAAWNIEQFATCSSLVDSVFCLLGAGAFVTHSTAQNSVCAHFSCFPNMRGESSLWGIALFFLPTEAIKKINMGWNMSDVSPSSILQPPKRHLSQPAT
jgi:hypothetical protein